MHFNTFWKLPGWLSLLTTLVVMTALGCSDGRHDPTFVEDRPGLLDTGQRQRIADQHRKLLEELDIHFVTVILDAPAEDLNAAATALFEAKAVGAGTRGARGILLLVDPLGKAVRLETGYDLEGIFTDAFVGYVEHRQMRPFFEAGRVGPGIEAAVELLVAKALASMTSGDYAVDQAGVMPGSRLSGGAGAKTAMPVGDTPLKKPASPLAGRFAPQATPGETLELYRQALELHVKDPDLGIYTPETRAFFRQWIVTDAQQSNERKGIEASIRAADVRIQGRLAVIRFPVQNRETAPYFFTRGEQGWMLDFHAMHRSIRFNHKNQWHFTNLDHAFMFAFADLRFDENGFPHR